jgi:hypothetical protein
MTRVWLAGALAAAALAAAPAAGADDPQRRDRGRPEHGRLHQGLSRADVREEISGREGERGRHRPGGRGSQKIYEKLDAQKKGGRREIDFDVVVVHQKAAGTMVQEGLLEKYKDKIATGPLATRDSGLQRARRRGLGPS